MKLWRSGIIYSAASFLIGLGNLAFQGIIGRLLSKAEFGYVNSTLGFIAFLGLPLTIASMSLTHYIASFRGANDDARLQGLMAGCQQFLLKITLIGSAIAIVLVVPLSRFFNFPRTLLMLVALGTVLVGLWSGLAVSMCQGMAWFKRIAVINVAGVGLRLAVGLLLVPLWPTAETAVLGTTCASLVSLALLYWWKDLFKTGEHVSPWNREFLHYFLVATASVGGQFFFTQGDVLVAQRYFAPAALGNYSAAAQLGRSLTMVAGPLLIVLFTSRSGGKGKGEAAEQKLLLGLYASALVIGGVGVVIFRNLLIHVIFGADTPPAAAMVAPFTMTMVFVGLVQAIGMWSLASRWFTLSLLYGALGLGYWLILLIIGTSPSALLTSMPICSAIAFAVMAFVWWKQLNRGLASPATSVSEVPNR